MKVAILAACVVACTKSEQISPDARGSTDAPAVDGAIDAPPPPSPRRAFVTPVIYPSNFAVGNGTATAFADGRCAFWGQDLGGTRPWVAWLSTNTSNAIDRFTSDGPWVRVDGKPIATNRVDLVDGSLANAIGLDPDGHTVDTRAFTGTGPDGKLEAAANLATCNNWSSDSTSVNYSYGDTQATDRKWSKNDFYPACGQSLPLLCFEQ